MRNTYANFDAQESESVLSSSDRKLALFRELKMSRVEIGTKLKNCYLAVEQFEMLIMEAQFRLWVVEIACSFANKINDQKGRRVQ